MCQVYSLLSATVTTTLERNKFRKGRLALVHGLRELLSSMVEKTQLTSWQLKQAKAEQKAGRAVGNKG